MFAVIHLPDFPLQAALRGCAEGWDTPVALLDTTRTPARVCAATAVARGLGIEAGLTATQAQARCGAVRIRQRSGERETVAADAVAQCAQAFSPALEATASGVWTLDLRALAALKGAGPADLAGWAERLRSALAGLELRAQIGVGSSPNLARHAARWGTMTGAGVQVVQDSATWVATLPVAVLEPSTAVASILETWGVRTVGELLKLGLSAVADRLGLEALALFAAADVTSIRPLRWLKPVEHFAEAHDFEEPVTTLESVLFLLRRFLDQLVRRLEPTGLVVGEMSLQLRLESGDTLSRQLCVPDPTRNAEVLFRMWHTHLETVRTESPVTGLALTVRPGRPVVRQFNLFQTVVRDPGQLQETLGRLEALLGPGRVGTPVRVPGHQRDAFRLAPPDFEQAPVNGPARPALLQPVPWRRLRPAPAAQVQSGTTQPVAVRCAVVAGRLKISVGPWRASGQWWDTGAWSREDWEVETATGIAARLSHSAAGWQVTDLLD